MGRLPWELNVCRGMPMILPSSVVLLHQEPQEITPFAQPARRWDMFQAIRSVRQIARLRNNHLTVSRSWYRTPLHARAVEIKLTRVRQAKHMSVFRTRIANVTLHRLYVPRRKFVAVNKDSQDHFYAGPRRYQLAGTFRYRV